MLRCLALTGILAAQHLDNTVDLSSKQPDDPAVQFTFESRGETYHFTITSGMLVKCPKWIKAENPPLTLSAARKEAQAYATKTRPEEKLNIASIALKKGPEDRWYYVIDLESVSTDEGPADLYEVVILMDGTVIDPVLLPST